MNKRELYNILSIFLAIVIFTFLTWTLLNGGSGTSFATFAFWTLIVGINTIVTIKEKGNFVFPLVLTVGNLIVSIALLATGQFWWGTTEWITLIFVLISLGVWATSSGYLTIIVSTIAITLGSIPQIVLAWNIPASIPLYFWIGLFVLSIFGLLAGREWSIKERLYSVARMLVYLLVIIFAMKRFF